MRLILNHYTNTLSGKKDLPRNTVYGEVAELFSAPLQYLTRFFSVDDQLPNVSSVSGHLEYYPLRSTTDSKFLFPSQTTNNHQAGVSQDTLSDLIFEKMDAELLVSVSNRDYQSMRNLLDRGASCMNRPHSGCPNLSALRLAVDEKDIKAIKVLKPYIVQDISRYTEELKANIELYNDIPTVKLELSRIFYFRMLLHDTSKLLEGNDKEIFSGMTESIYKIGLECSRYVSIIRNRERSENGLQDNSNSSKEKLTSKDKSIPQSIFTLSRIVKEENEQAPPSLESSIESLTGAQSNFPQPRLINDNDNDNMDESNIGLRRRNRYSSTTQTTPSKGYLV